MKRFLTGVAIAALLAAPLNAGPFGDNPLAWIAKHSTRGGEYNPPSGARSGLAPEVRGYGQRLFGVNSNDARKATIVVSPVGQHGEFQHVSLLFKDLVDEGAAHIAVRGSDGRSLGRIDLDRVGKSANGKITRVEIPLTGAQPGESIKLAVTVDDFLGKGGNGWTIIGAEARQNCEPIRPDIRFVREDISTPPVPQRKQARLDDKKVPTGDDKKARGNHRSDPHDNKRDGRREGRKGK